MESRGAVVSPIKKKRPMNALDNLAKVNGLDFVKLIRSINKLHTVTTRMAELWHKYLGHPGLISLLRL